MSFLEKLRAVAIGASVLVGLAGAVMLLLGPEKLAGLFGESELPEIDFATLTREAKAAKSYLVCPEDACPANAVDETAPILDLPAEDLRARLFEFAEVSPDIRIFRMDVVRGQYVFTERTPAMRIPDVITVRIYPLPEGSTLAIYSRSVGSASDREDNRRRVRRWLAVLDSAS